MATQRRKESERWFKRQGSGIRKEGGDEFKASPTRGRIKEKIFLCEDGGYEIKVNFRENGERSEQQNQQKLTRMEVLND
jgi:hypothetical protein